MMKLKKRTLVMWALSIGAFSSFVGALGSTLAWWAYSTTISVSMKGTAINETEQLQVGLKTNISFSEEIIEEYSLTQETISGESYIFAAPGRGFSSDIISYYLKNTSYASNTLTPVTSNRYKQGDDLELKQAPHYGNSSINTEAMTSNYCYIPFAFRIIRLADGRIETYQQKQPIWISNARAVADYGVTEIYKSVRVHFSGSKFDAANNIIDNKFIFNPSALEDKPRFNLVAGLLNLNDDDYYDIDNSYGVNGTEIIYGDYEGTPIASTDMLEEDSAIHDINQTGKSTITTFTAKHQENNCVFEDYTSFTPHKAEFKSLGDIKPTTDEQGYLKDGEIVAVTSDDVNGVALLNTTIYIEGWDHSVIDQEAEHGFYLGLTFEINKV